MIFIKKNLGEKLAIFKTKSTAIFAQYKKYNKR
jgi:hypothetical protein